MSDTNGGRAAPPAAAFRRTDAPYYLARYSERKSLQAASQAATTVEPDADLPLYLRRFRERAGSGQGQAAASALLEVDGERFTPEFAGTSRDKEIVARGPGLDGRLAVHQRGHSLSKSVRPGQKVRIVCADTSRARQTADQIYRGMNDGLQQWGRQAEIGAPEAIPELRNFQVWTPEGPARRHLGVPPVPGEAVTA